MTDDAEILAALRRSGWRLPSLDLRDDDGERITICWSTADWYAEVEVSREGVEVFWRDRRTGRHGGTEGPILVPGLLEALLASARCSPPSAST